MAHLSGMYDSPNSACQIEVTCMGCVSAKSVTSIYSICISRCYLHVTSHAESHVFCCDVSFLVSLSAIQVALAAYLMCKGCLQGLQTIPLTKSIRICQNLWSNARAKMPPCNNRMVRTLLILDILRRTHPNEAQKFLLSVEEAMILNMLLSSCMTTALHQHEIWLAV